MKIRYHSIHIIPELNSNIAKIKELSGGTSELLINEINISGIHCCILCCEGLVSTAVLTHLVLHPLMETEIPDISPKGLLEHINSNMMLSIDRPIADNYGDMFRLLNSGFVVLAADGADFVLAFGAQGHERRGISEPFAENNLTGSHDGFTELIRTNMSLIRRRIKSPNYVQKLGVIGDSSQTDICICYMSDRVPQELIDRIYKSIDKIKLESVFSTGYMKPFLEPKKKSIFSSVGMTERPDVLCSKLMEGRVALLIDGNPYALYIPKLVSDNFQTLDDYNFKPYFGTFLRLLKYTAFLLAIILPALYVAIAVHHPEMLNSTLLMILADAEKNAPFSITAETVGVLIMYEIIKEAGVRLPKAVGGAVSIVAGIIIGDSAVQSGLISTPLLTVAAISVISGFVIPGLSQSISVLRIIFVICGGIWGLFGISLCAAVVLFNLCSTEDYGFPYTAPFSPFIKNALSDTLVRTGFRKKQEKNFTVEELYDKN